MLEGGWYHIWRDIPELCESFSEGEDGLAHG